MQGSYTAIRRDNSLFEKAAPGGKGPSLALNRGQSGRKMFGKTSRRNLRPFFKRDAIWAVKTEQGGVIGSG
jgi:hypothetical protein